MSKVSGFLSTNTRERIKALLLAVVGTIAVSLLSLVKSGVFPTTFEEIKPSLLAGAFVGLTYIITTWLTPAGPNALEKAITKE